MKVAVVILNWNTVDYLRKYLPGLISSVKGHDAAVIVADNGSTDGSVEMLEKEFPEVERIVFDHNLGFTGGYNKALGMVDAEYFVLANSDIEFSEGWLGPMLETMEKYPRTGACAPKLHSMSDREMFEYAGAAGGLIDRFGFPFCLGRMLGTVEKDGGQYDHDNAILWVSGACMMVRSSVFREMGGLDERFFAHMEEIDLCWRMQTAGYEVRTAYKSVVWHVGGGTLPAKSPWKLKLNYRNNLLMLQNNLPSTEALLMTKEKDVGKMSGEEIGKICREACRKAGRKIFVRMLIDGLAATAYLLKLDWASFRAVLNAHREFRKLGIAPDPGKVAARLKAHPHALIGGLYRGSILWQALRHGKKAISRTDNTDQYFWN